MEKNAYLDIEMCVRVFVFYVQNAGKNKNKN